MKRKTMLILLITVAANTTIISKGNTATTINASTCSSADVQKAINSASTGDTVIVPACSVTWSTTLNIPTDKSLKLVGAGIGITNITASVNGATLISIGENNSEISGFTFDDGKVTLQGRGWRVYSNRFTSDCTGGSVQEGITSIGSTTYGFDNAPKGLIDNNQFHNMRIISFGGPSIMANEIWGRNLNLGTDEAVYIEDNVFTYANCSVIQAADANYGGSYVFRYNTVQDASVMAHAVQSGNRATRKWEIYNNLFWQSGSAWTVAFLRAGTGVFFGNEIVGTWTAKGVVIDEQRSCDSKDTSGKCDGNSSWDGNTAGEYGYPCRDQIGRSTDAVAIGYKETPGVAQAQALDPAYAWSNYVYPTEEDRVAKKNGVAYEFDEGGICAEAKAHLKEGIDYFNNGVTPKPNYTPYTYPHPLRSSVNTKIDPPIWL